MEASESDIIVRLENIHKTYLLGIEGVPALRHVPRPLRSRPCLLAYWTRGVSLSIKKGEFVCIFGLSGGGKTTLMNIIGTIDTPTKGDMYLGGYRTYKLSLRRMFS